MLEMQASWPFHVSLNAAPFSFPVIDLTKLISTYGTGEGGAGTT